MWCKGEVIALLSCFVLWKKSSENVGIQTGQRQVEAGWQDDCLVVGKTFTE